MSAILKVQVNAFLLFFYKPENCDMHKFAFAPIMSGHSVVSLYIIHIFN